MWATYFKLRPANETAALPTKEARMTWSMWIRQVHRWPGIIFTMTVIANFIAMALGQPPAWIVYSPLAPLFLLLFSGLYMFALPCLRRSRSARQGS